MCVCLCVYVCVCEHELCVYVCVCEHELCVYVCVCEHELCVYVRVCEHELCVYVRVCEDTSPPGTTEKIFQSKTQLYDVFVDCQKITSNSIKLDPILKLSPSDHQRFEHLNNIR